MDGYTILGGFLIFFLFFIYIVWFGFSVKVENEKEEGSEIKINPYDNLPLHRKLIDKKNSRVGMLDLGNHILIIGLILVVIFVITFIGIYSDFILAAIFLKDKNLWTVAVGINTVFVDDFNADWGVIAASSVIAATPIAVLFIFFQKQITGGLTAGSVKG